MGNGIDKLENATHKRCSCKKQIKSSTWPHSWGVHPSASPLSESEEGSMGFRGYWSPKRAVLRGDYQHRVVESVRGRLEVKLVRQWK